MDLSWFRENASGFTGPMLFDEPLARHSYYRIGGKASLIVHPRSVEDLKWLAKGIRETAVPAYVIGAGSNLLVSDAGYLGMVIKSTRFEQRIDVRTPPGEPDSRIVTTTASVAISSLLRRAGQEGWKGFELWTGIPGNVGGAVAMNAGTHLGESKDIAFAVSAFSLKSGEELRYGPEALRFDYRRNLFLPPDSFVYEASWKVQQADPALVQSVITETLARRKASQPIDYPSCGSVFKNPKSHGIHAWQVIEKVGLRGHRIGGAEFSPKHCNFIVNLGGAQAQDVRLLILEAKQRAREQLGIELEEEVKYLGF